MKDNQLEMTNKKEENRLEMTKSKVQTFFDQFKFFLISNSDK